jgi:hypothetical protein
MTILAGCRLVCPRLLVLALERGSTYMKRVGTLLTVAFVGSMMMGCESGREEGLPSEVPTTHQTPEFKELMEKTGNKMLKKQNPKGFGGPAKTGP